jgi:catechol 2,3-dioxygenase-like lactoylglutathione lyase family enzyme
MGVSGILHTGLTVSDLDRSVAFYRDLLGLELITQWDSSQPYLRTVVGYPDAELRIALLRLPAAPDAVPGHHIELLEYRRPRGSRGDANTYIPGNGHVAFMVENLDATYAELRARGCASSRPRSTSLTGATPVPRRSISSIPTTSRSR